MAGLDIALWDALAQAAGLPLAVLLGGTLVPVPAYNSNGLGLIPPERAADEALELLAEGGFTGDGHLHLPDVPGNGLAWDEDAVAHFQADP